METPENSPQGEENEENVVDGSQMEDVTPLEPGETPIPFSEDDVTADDTFEGREVSPVPDAEPDDTISEDPPDLSTGPQTGQDLRPCPSCQGNMTYHSEGCPGPPSGEPESDSESSGGPPAEAFDPIAEGMPTRTTGDTEPIIVEALPDDGGASTAPAWANETASGRRPGGKPGRKPGRKTGKKQIPKPVMATESASEPQRISVSFAIFVNAPQIFNQAKTSLRAGGTLSGNYENLEMWLADGLLWVRRLNTAENEFEHCCVPLSNVGSFTPIN